MLVKEKVIAVMQDLPEHFSVEELFDKVILLEKIERGMEESRAGQVKDTDQAKELLTKWLH